MKKYLIEDFFGESSQYSYGLETDLILIPCDCSSTTPSTAAAQRFRSSRRHACWEPTVLKRMEPF